MKTKLIYALFCAVTVFCTAFTLFFQPLALSSYGEAITVYTKSASSNAEIITTKPSSVLFFNDVRGESVVVDSNRFNAKQILDSYGATVRFSEVVDGVTSYYAYTDKLPYSQNICGYTVNLHVAVCGERTVIGTPIIFGGY